MEIRELRYFWTVAEEKSFTKAAKILHITQPTLSRQMKELEERLGTPLFIRQKKQLLLTEEGHFLKERAFEILTLAERTERDFASHGKRPLTGSFTMGCVEADNSDTMAMMIEEFISDYPQVTFNIVSGTSDDISDKLEKGILDMAILLEPIDVPQFEKLLLPREEKWGLLVSRDSVLAEKTGITPTDLVGIPILGSHRLEVQSLVETWLGQPLSQLNVVGSFNLITNMFPLVANHVGSALTIEGAAKNSHPAQLVFVPLMPEVKTNCVLVWKKNRQQTPVVKALIQRFAHAFEA